MSVVKIQRTKSVGAATVYAVYGTYENMRNDDIRAAAYSVVSATPGATPKQFINETIAEIARHPRRGNQAELIIQSFHPDELDKDNPFDVQLAHLAGLELARRIAPNSDVVVATHIDSESGHVHNHIIIVNHDRETGKTPRNARNFHAVKRANDAAMEDLGLEVYEPEQQQEQQQQNLRGVPLPVITKDNWRAEMQNRVDAVLADPRVAAATTVSGGLEVAQAIAGEYSVSFRVTTHEKQDRDDVTVTSYALVDDDGEPVRYATSRGSRSTKRTGSRLGKERYTYEAVQQRIEQLQQQYQQQLNQQQQLKQQESYHAPETQEEEHSEPEPAGVQAGGTGGAGGTESLREKYAGILADEPDTADTSAAAPGAGDEDEHADALHGDSARRTVFDDREREGTSHSSSYERDVPGRRERENQAAVGRSRSPVQPEPASEPGAAGPQTPRSSTPAAGSSSPRQAGTTAPWSPDDSVESMRQVDFGFLAERIMNDEFRQFQRSEFDGTDAEYFAHLLDDDAVVAAEHKDYAHARTRLFDPVGGQRERMQRTVGENRRRAAAIQRQRQQRQNQQQQQQNEQNEEQRDKQPD